MQQTVIINGMETVLEIPEGQAVSAVTHTGSNEDYRIEYGNGLIEVGGIVEVPCTTVTDGVIEGTLNVQLPFSKVFTFQATAMNVVAEPSATTGESAFITKIANGYKIYATAKSTENRTIPVQWTSRGVL